MNRKLIHQVFEYQVNAQPDCVAIEQEGLSLTYAELNGLSNRIAHVLMSLIKGAEEPVAVFGNRDYQLVASALGIFKAGQVFVPLDITHPTKTLAKKLDVAAPGVVLVSASQVQKVKELFLEVESSVRQILVIDDLQNITLCDAISGELHDLQELNGSNPELQIGAESSNYIYFTSGTTGTPKAILGMHQSLGHFIHWEASTFDITAKDRVAQLIQFTFDAYLRDVFVPLSVGGTLCIPSEAIYSDFSSLMQWVSDQNISLMHSVPSLFRLMIKEYQAQSESSAKRFESLRYIMLSGEPVYAKDVHAWNDLAGDSTRLINFYGPTETTMIKTYHVLGGGALSNHSCVVGKPISHTKIAILNNGQACGVGEIGEVYIKTPFASKGYYHDDEATNQVFVQNPMVKNKKDIIYKTGDLGRLDKEMNLEILGRIDDQVKVNGVRIELKEIERVLQGHDQIVDALVRVHRDESNNALLTGYYISEDLEESRVKTYLSDFLDQGKVPTHLVRMNEFPLTYNGKVDKKALPHPSSLEEVTQDYEIRGETESKIAAIWAEVLGKEKDKLSRNIQFFDVGGSSLRAIQVVARVFKQFGVRLIIGDIFRNNTIAKLAAHIDELTITEDRSIPAVSPAETYPVSHAQKRLWIMDQYEKDQFAYNINACYRLLGPLDPQAMATAFDQLVERHESLRTTFKNVHGNPVQKILEISELVTDLQFIDLSESADQKTQIDEIRNESYHHVFDLAAGPLFLVRLIKQAPDVHLFILSIHHIIADGWSMHIMVDDLIAYYNANVDGVKADLPSLPIQYRDYSNWHNARLQGTEGKQHERFWRSQFYDFDQKQRLVTEDALLAQAGDFTGSRHRFEVSHALSQSLKKTAADNKATLFQTLLTTVYALLFIRYGKEDLTIGSPMAGRTYKELENQIGLFVNMLPIRIQLASENTLSMLLAHVAKTCAEAYEHEIYPFDRIVEDLGLSKNSQGLSLFDVVVQLQDTEMQQSSKADAQALTFEEVPSDFMAAKFPLTFDFYDGADGLSVEIEYQSGLFTLEEIGQMASDFENLLNQITKKEQMSLASLKMDLNPEVFLNEEAESLINLAIDESF